MAIPFRYLAVAILFIVGMMLMNQGVELLSYDVVGGEGYNARFTKGFHSVLLGVFLILLSIITMIFDQYSKWKNSRQRENVITKVP